MKPRSASMLSRLARNSASIAISRTVMAVVTLAAMPIYISRLGLAGYGVWEIILTIAGFSVLWQGPVSGALMWACANAFGSGKYARVREVVHIGIFASLVSTALLLPAVFALRHFLAVFHVPPAQQPQVAIILPAVLAATLLGGINEAYAAAIDGCQRNGRTAAVRAGAHFSGTLVSIAAVLTGHGLYSLVFGQWASFVTAWLGLRVLVRSVCPAVRFGVRIPCARDARKLLAYASLLFVGYISAAFREQTDKLVLAVFATPVWVGYYTIAGRLTSIILELCKFIYGPTVSAAGALWARADTISLKALYSTVMTWLPAALGAGVLFTGGLHRDLVVLWLGRHIPQVTPMVLLLLAGNAAAAMLTGPGTAICRGIGRVALETRYVVVSLIGNVLLTVILVNIIGPMGTVWASAVSWAGGSLYFALLLPNKLRFPAAPAIRAGAILATSLVFATMLHWLSRSLFGVTSRVEALVAIACLTPPALMVYGIFLFATGLLPRCDVSRWRSVVLGPQAFQGEEA